MIRKGLFASTLVASALFAAPQAHAAINFGSVSNIINQLNNGSSFAPNSMTFSAGGQQFTGISGVRNFNANAGNLTQFNNWAGTANYAATGYNGYSFTYSAIGNFFNTGNAARNAPLPDDSAPQSRFVPSTAAIPEPGTWAMMIIGMGVVGLTMRRRANHKAKYFA